MIEDLRVGNYIIFRRNIPGYYSSPQPTPDRMRGDLSEQLRLIAKAVSRETGVIPILAADHEGGATTPFQSGVLTELPSPMALGATRSLRASREAAAISAGDMRSVGLNTNLAPVCDVNTNSKNDLIGDRSFGGHHSLVAPMAREYSNSLQRHGVIAVAKHFPGHGSTNEGIETPGAPISRLTIDGLLNALQPFRSLTQDGVDALMTSHFVVESVSNDIVTLSPRLVRDLIRSDVVTFADGREVPGLSYRGVVIADDILLPALTHKRGEVLNSTEYVSRVFEMTVRAWEAGHDMLMFAHVLGDSVNDKEVQTNSAQPVRKALRLSEFREVMRMFEEYVFSGDGDASIASQRKARLRESIRRVLTAKARMAARLGEESVSPVVEGEVLTSARALFRAGFLEIQSRMGMPNLARLSTDDRVVFLFPQDFQDPGQMNAVNRDDRNRVLRNASVFAYPSTFSQAFRDRLDVQFWMYESYPKPEQYVVRARELLQDIVGLRPSVVVIEVRNRNEWELLSYLFTEIRSTGAIAWDRLLVVVSGYATLVSSVGPQFDELVGNLNLILTFSSGRVGAEELWKMLREGESLAVGAEIPVAVFPLIPSPNWELR